MKKIFSGPALMIFFALIVTSSFAQIDYKGFPQWSWHKQDSTEYYLYTPSNLKQGELYPIAVFLHGCCGSSYKATLRNAVDPPARMWHNFGANTQTIPTYIISPATSRGWRQHIDNLKKVIDDLVKNHQGDPRRIYISGFSMGGDGTVAFIEKYPELFAAALPMGMDFRADLNTIKDIPIWTNKGETDWWARGLNKKVAAMRKLNGDDADSSANFITGVNPRLTEFKGVGHGVQWVAASTQDLTGWAYSKVNDGNKYPVVFLTSPQYKTVVADGKIVKLSVEAHDPDGTIKTVEMYVNGKLSKKFTTDPFDATIVAGKGDTKVEAIAFDDKGKSSTAVTIIKVNIPARILTKELTKARQAAFYSMPLVADGNGEKTFSVAGNTSLPDGLKLTSRGIIRGIPVVAGSHKVSIEVKDEDGDVAVSDFELVVGKKSSPDVLVTNAKNYAGKKFPVSKVAIGESAHGDRGDDEVTFSNVGRFEGLTLIQTDVSDTITAKPHYMEFEVDEDVTVYVAYETLDNLLKSSIPDWLKEFRKEDGSQIVTQYFYYNVYSKHFPKGKVILPDAEEKTNGVSTNYFVMVKKAGNR